MFNQLMVFIASTDWGKNHSFSRSIQFKRRKHPYVVLMQHMIKIITVFMIYFSSFEELWQSLVEAVKSKKEVYVFEFSNDEKHDFCREDDENGTVNFYVHPLIEISAMQRTLLFKERDGKLFDDDSIKLATCHDYYFDDDILIGRLYIFYVSE